MRGKTYLVHAVVAKIIRANEYCHKLPVVVKIHLLREEVKG